MSKKGFIPILFLLLLTIFGILIITIFIYNERINPYRPQKTILTDTSPTPLSQKFLVNKTPHFDNLQPSDLPSFLDYRSIYKYKNNYVIIGYSRVVEYDPAKKEILRQDNNTSLKTINSGAVIGKYLFVTGEKSNSKVEDFPPKRYLLKIDLDSGDLIREYFDDDPRHFGNLNVTTDGTNAWFSSWDGMGKIATDDSIVWFNYKDLKLTSSECPMGIYSEDYKIIVQSNCNGLGLTFYNPQTNSWSYKTVQTGEYNKYFYVKPKDYGIELPTFSLLSPKINNKYYIFTNNSIFTLNENEFPKFYKSVTNNNSYSMPLEPKIYIDNEEKFALIIGPLGGINISPELGAMLSAQLIDLSTGTTKDLIKDYPVAKFIPDDKLNQRLSNISSTQVVVTGNNLEIKDEFGQMFNIDLQKYQLMLPIE